MLKQIHKKRGQAVMGEYVLVFFLAAGVIGAMTIYFKRAVQARIHDARDYMISSVRRGTQGEFSGNLYLEYEPYYLNTAVTIDRSASHDKRLSPSPGLASGIFREGMDETTSAVSVSDTAPPAEFDRTTPKN